MQKPLLERLSPDPIVQGSFRGKKSEAATDLSGLDCRPMSGGLQCLAVNDEGTVAQLATYSGNVLIPGKIVPLVGNAPPTQAFGTPPENPLPGEPVVFKEFDGEGVAYANGAFYVAGSHGRGRNSGRFRISSFLVARVPTDAKGELGAPELTWRLSEALTADTTLRSHFGLDLNTQNGLNIEGITVVGDRLFAGLRGPSLDGKAFLVSAKLTGLFSGSEPLNPIVVPLALGEHAGIRDLPSLQDGRLLVLTGPAQDQDTVPYGLSLVTLNPSTVTKLGPIEDALVSGKRAKAEALCVTRHVGSEVDVLVLFDGAENGGPRAYRIHMPN